MGINHGWGCRNQSRYVGANTALISAPKQSVVLKKADALIAEAVKSRNGIMIRSHGTENIIVP